MGKNPLQCRRLASVPDLGRSPGKGNGILLQYFCWEIPWVLAATVHGVAKSQTQLSDWVHTHTLLSVLGFRKAMAIILFRQSLDLGNMRNFIFRYTLFIPILRASLAAQMIKICLQCGRLGFKPRVGKISWRTEWQPPPVFLPGEFHRQRSLAIYSPWGRKWTWLSDWYAHTCQF